MFAKRLREPVMRGEVTCSVRIRQSPRVKVGGRYALGDGHIEMTFIRKISLADVTPTVARRSGSNGLVDLLKAAKPGPGDRAFFVQSFHEGLEG